MADASLQALQATLNKYADPAGFTPLNPDGLWGPRTANAVTMAPAWVAKAPAIDPSFREAARNHSATWDNKPGPRLMLIAVFLGSIAANLGLRASAQAAVPASSPPSSYPPPPSLPPTGIPGTAQTPAVLPPVKYPVFATSVNVFGKAVPAWLLYGAGAALVLGVGALVLTKPKPSAPTV